MTLTENFKPYWKTKFLKKFTDIKRQIDKLITTKYMEIGSIKLGKMMRLLPQLFTQQLKNM